MAHKVCLLLIESFIALEQPEAALSIVNYVESQFISTDNSKISTVDKDSVIKSVKEPKEQKKEATDTALDAFKIRLLKCKVRIYLMMHQLKLCKREWKLLVSSATSVNISTVFLKANLEYLRGNYKKAIKLLNSVTTENLDFKTCGESTAVLYYNNMACIHFAMGKPNLACFYLKKALQENKAAVESVEVKDSDPLVSQPLYTINGNKYYQLMYSLGVALLYAGQAAKAFDSFLEAAQYLHHDPRVWLRMAECCISCQKSTNETDFNLIKRRSDLIQKTIGSGFYRKVILVNSDFKKSKYNYDGLSYAIPQPTLEFGLLCLKNALMLVRPKTATTPAAEAESSPQVTSLVLPGARNKTRNPSSLVSETGCVKNLNLEIAILAATTYVSLCLGDYVSAHYHAENLLRIPKLPGAYKLLANLYIAESLIFMDKISEAIKHLKPKDVQDLNTFVPVPEFQDKDKDKTEEVAPKPIKSWYPNTIPTSIAVIRYNLAVAYAIRGELDKSGEILKQVWMSKGADCDVPIQVIMLALYIELQLGHADISRSIIKQHCPQYRLQ